jgi:uncharacterized membrane protein YgcG
LGLIFYIIFGISCYVSLHCVYFPFLVPYSITDVNVNSNSGSTDGSSSSSNNSSGGGGGGEEILVTLEGDCFMK